MALHVSRIWPKEGLGVFPVERGRNEVGTEVLLAISREFGRSLEWLLTAEG
jgi:hypothetical protein